MDACLDAVLAQDLADFEVVVVVDDRSVEPVAEHLRDRAAACPVPVRVLDASGPVSRLRDVAARAATGAVLAWTDSDCRPHPGWLAAGVRAVSSAAEVGVVQGRTVPRAAERPGGLCGRWPATLDVPSFDGLYETCNLFVRAAAYAETPGFEAGGVDFQGEDVWLGWQVTGAGWASAFAPEALVEHDTSYPGFGWHVRKLRYYANWPLLLGQDDRMRDSLAHSRYLLRSRDRQIVAAAAGLCLAPVTPLALVAVVPWLRLRRPGSTRPGDVLYSASLLVHDAVSFSWLIRSSLRHRSLVL